MKKKAIKEILECVFWVVFGIAFLTLLAVYYPIQFH